MSLTDTLIQRGIRNLAEALDLGDPMTTGLNITTRSSMPSIFEQRPPGYVDPAILTDEQKRRVAALDAADRTVGNWEDAGVDDLIRVATFVLDGPGGYIAIDGDILRTGRTLTVDFAGGPIENRDVEFGQAESTIRPGGPLDPMYVPSEREG